MQGGVGGDKGEGMNCNGAVVSGQGKDGQKQSGRNNSLHYFGK